MSAQETHTKNTTNSNNNLFLKFFNLQAQKESSMGFPTTIYTEHIFSGIITIERERHRCVEDI